MATGTEGARNEWVTTEAHRLMTTSAQSDDRHLLSRLRKARKNETQGLRSSFFSCAFQLFLKYLAMSISNWAELADERNFPVDWSPYCCRANSRFRRSLSFPGSLAQLLLVARAKSLHQGLGMVFSFLQGWGARSGREGGGGVTWLDMTKVYSKLVLTHSKPLASFHSKWI